MSTRPSPHLRASMFYAAFLGGHRATAQTRIGKCSGGTTFNSIAKVAFINLERATEISIRLHRTIQGRED